MPSDPSAIDLLIDRALHEIETRRKPIESTYRVQLHAKFTFRDAAKIVPYLADLGITHLYTSPYLKARPGSMHGYDVVDHCRLNPELGTNDDFEALLTALKNRGMSHIADIVPNHIGVATNDNIWWNDVLENGPASLYARYFDINWDGSPLTNLNGRVLLPVLGAMYGPELEKGNLKIGFENGGFFVAYYERKFPLSPKTYPMILGESAPDALIPILQACRVLPDRCEGADAALARHESKEAMKRRLAEIAAKHRMVIGFITERLAFINGTPGDPTSFDHLDDLLRHQCFRLACWKTAPDEINYRRFFDVNSLAALAMERPEVFNATHWFILSLLGQGKIAGLRIDHPDGLFDPEQYFHRLQSHYVAAVAGELSKETDRKTVEQKIGERLKKSATRPLYILGEKILALDEPMVKTWPIDGTTGYDFLNMTNGLFVDTRSADDFTRIYHNWIGDTTSFEDLAYQKKKLILDASLASELNMLAMSLKRIAEQRRDGIDFSLRGLRAALTELIACFPIYRTYISHKGVSDADRRHVQRAVDTAIHRNPTIEPAIFHFIRDILLDGDPNFAGKFQQLTSPVTAKGIEDTAFYIYNRLLSLNEVGGNPDRFGIEPAKLHEFFQQRQRDWPRSMSTLSTHDTKRSEDVRARINVLSEIPGEWEQHLHHWSRLNAPHRTMIDGIPAPDRNEEYAIYQTLLGAWPIETGDLDPFRKRIGEHMLKFMREAKVRTNWANPNKPREEAVNQFLKAILDPARAGEFQSFFLQFQRKISSLGMMNSLSQTLIKLTAPGIPDTYQGNELWDFSLVDPDNRRPVNFDRRGTAIRNVSKSSLHDLLKIPETGAVKLALIQKTLHLRCKYPGLFTTGEYLPIQSTGEKAQHVFAFARRQGRHIAIVAVPRLISSLIGESVWDDTYLNLPEVTEGRTFQNLLTGASLRNSDSKGRICNKDFFSECPFVLFFSK